MAMRRSQSNPSFEGPIVAIPIATALHSTKKVHRPGNYFARHMEEAEEIFPNFEDPGMVGQERGNLKPRRKVISVPN